MKLKTFLKNKCKAFFVPLQCVRAVAKEVEVATTAVLKRRMILIPPIASTSLSGIEFRPMNWQQQQLSLEEHYMYGERTTSETLELR
ncbi:hypothetical protein TNIN_104701 [Trichonephila inaurata madagascariensis]|uniref:Uncharacterized protein n=1 Tax=Trichonephila inaurata madagascariensis TaxID=2747483 RepID=A0A8X6Y6S3_9ARAC|nr:hypothetical protein TNIN_104701 [Trichonephila inaurata madagascariensis]